MTLFLKECKKVLFSLPFLIYCITVFVMYGTQFAADCEKPLEPPRPGLESYGMTVKEDPGILMPAAAESLVGEYLSGSFTAYPYGFVKEVKLKEKERARMAEIIWEVSGITAQQLDAFEDFEQGGYVMDENGQVVYLEPNLPEVHLPAGLTYERFRQLMDEADELIGGGSKYGDAYLVKNFSLVPKTYEDAAAEYEAFLKEDRITGAYARLYCDYMGIILSVLPVFVAAALAGLDKRSRMEQLIHVREISSCRLIFVRFLALAAVMTAPVILTAISAQIKVAGLYPGYAVDPSAIYRYAVFWLLPNLLTASAAGMLITEISSGLLAVFVQGAWWVASIFSSADLTGAIGRFTLVMRHNSLMGREIFFAQWDQILFNRMFFTLLSLLGAALTVLVYEKKRRGNIHGSLFQIPACHRRRQSKA